MKKVLFLFMLIGAASQVKAQTWLQIQPFNKLPDSLTRIIPQKPNLIIPQKTDSSKPDLSKQYVYNPMPIVKMEGRSNMPVVKMQGNSRMPVINPVAVLNRIISKELP